MVLASTTTDSLEALTTFADRIMEASSPPSVATVTVEESKLSVEISQICYEVSALKQMIHSLKSFKSSCTSARHRSPSPAPQQYCQYHTRLGDRATKCQQPYFWQPKNSQTGHWWWPVSPANIITVTHFSYLIASHDRFLIDTGAENSVIPPSKADKTCHQIGLELQAANGTSIPTYGLRSLTLN